MFPTLIAQAAAQPPSIIDMAMPIVLILFVFYFVMWRPQAKRQREQETYLNSLKSGDEVVTAGGIVGTIKSVDGKLVTLDISKGTKIRVLKSQIRGSLGKFTGSSEDEEKSES